MTAKKTTPKKTENNKYTTLFNSCPYFVLSKFEQENFIDQSGSSYSRSVIELINRIRKIDSDLEVETKAFEKQVLNEEKDKIIEFLDSQDYEVLTSAVNQWEEEEKDYWVNLLGKQAAIELLAFGKPSVETMTKMVKLPEDLYIKATQICVRLANAIKVTTAEAEQEIGFADEDESSPNVESGPKKLLLKKVK